MAQVALAWELSKEAISAPIVGSTSLDNLKELLGKQALTRGSYSYLRLTKVKQPRSSLDSRKRKSSTWRNHTNPLASSATGEAGEELIR